MKKGKGKPPPKVELMPSLRRKVEKKKESEKHMELLKKIHKPLLHEIALFLCDSFRATLKFMRICKRFHDTLYDSFIWTFMYYDYFPKENATVKGVALKLADPTSFEAKVAIYEETKGKLCWKDVFSDTLRTVT